MTARLRESLHTAAADVPAYPVYKRALATARRSRRRTALGAAAGLALVVTAGLFLPRRDRFCWPGFHRGRSRAA